MEFFVSVTGYDGQPVSIVGGLDEKTNILAMVGQLKEFQKSRIVGREDLSVITNLPLPDLDFQFRDDHISDAIRAFYNRKAMNTITLTSKVKAFDPQAAIEKDDIKEGGSSYRIMPTITNGQMAILMACYFCMLQERVMGAQTAIDEMNDLYDQGGGSDLYDIYSI